MTPIPTAAEPRTAPARGRPTAAAPVRRRLVLVTSVPRTAIRGYRAVSAAERAGFGMLASFAVTIGASRAINYVLERRRNAPRLRSWARAAYHFPGREQLRIHHFIPGIGLAFLSGAAAILKRDDGREVWLSLPFGVGAGLTFDEVAVLTELDNPYWESEKLAAAQAISAALPALAIASHLYRRGLPDGE